MARDRGPAGPQRFDASTGATDTPGNGVMAFDAAGQTNCAPSGTTTVCSPLWTSTTNDTLSQEAPAVGSGIVAVRSDTYLFALDPSTGAARWSAVIGSIAQAPQLQRPVTY